MHRTVALAASLFVLAGPAAAASSETSNHTLGFVIESSSLGKERS